MPKNVETTGHGNVHMQKQNVSKQKIVGIINKKDMKILVAGSLFFVNTLCAFSFRTIIFCGAFGSWNEHFYYS